MCKNKENYETFSQGLWQVRQMSSLEDLAARMWNNGKMCKTEKKANLYCDPAAVKKLKEF